MHDPMVVAHEIRRPWPSRSKWHDTKPDAKDAGYRRRWAFRYFHDCEGGHPGATGSHEQCEGYGPWRPWWKPSNYMAFSTIAGRGYYWPSMITVWHHEPHGRDSGEVCPHRVTDPKTGKFVRWSVAWKWHVIHLDPKTLSFTKGWGRNHRFGVAVAASVPVPIKGWSIQFSPWQSFVRWAFTRCAWCGGRSRRGDTINLHIGGWEESSKPPRFRFYRGERNLVHMDCGTAKSLAKVCACEKPTRDDDASHRGYAWMVCTCGGTRQLDIPTGEPSFFSIIHARVVREHGRPVPGRRYVYPKWATEAGMKHNEQLAAQRRVIEAAEEAARG